MLTGRTLVAVKLLKPFGDWKAGDTVLIEDWKAKELWESGVVEIIDESDKVIIELEKAITEERENKPLTDIDESLYERAEFYIYYLSKLLQDGQSLPPESLKSYLAKLSNLKEKYEELKTIRFGKILKTVMLRPNSLEVLSKLAPEEREIYLQMSKIRIKWLGEG
ncbi:MAG: DNA replication complex GINS family protein [Thermococcus sp.]|uniref:hypothetical protein n=1 Tax=Thermococcus sp. TaxID=35749 RepID=UPI001E0CB552|nr:hypothetical protein [Thermococcus sp.]MBO8174777.1 DNA replication complex GINS family protein [Thermococcus sp.]